MGQDGAMRVLFAPDAFTGTLTAVEAAESMAAGWGRQAPNDELDLAPMSDGGTGFVDVLSAGLGGDLLAVTVSGPHGQSVPGTILLRDRTAYVESAQAAGRHLVTDPETASSVGVGELVAAAIDAGADRVVVGLGGLGTIDGGAGLLGALGGALRALGALGAEAGSTRGSSVGSAAGASEGRSLLGGVAGLDGLADDATIALDAARGRVGGVRIIAATDLDATLTGLFGVARSQGPDRGLDDERIAAADVILERWAHAAGRRVSLDPGAGAGGGVGFALMLLGAERESGIGLVSETLGLDQRARTADLVVTGEGAFDFSSRSGKVPYGVAEVAAEALRPCIALAGRVLVGSREMRALGIESAYSVTDLVGEQRALAAPADALADLAARVARTWSR